MREANKDMIAIEIAAESAFNDMIAIVEKHGTCYFRFDPVHGLTIIDPKYNAQINGVISDA